MKIINCPHSAFYYHSWGAPNPCALCEQPISGMVAQRGVALCGGGKRRRCTRLSRNCSIDGVDHADNYCVHPVVGPDYACVICSNVIEAINLSNGGFTFLSRVIHNPACEFRVTHRWSCSLCTKIVPNHHLPCRLPEGHDDGECTTHATNGIRDVPIEEVCRRQSFSHHVECEIGQRHDGNMRLCNHFRRQGQMVTFCSNERHHLDRCNFDE